MTIVNDTSDDRAVVANFAAYAVGSCYGDFDARCQLTHDRVLADDAAYEFYRNEHQHHMQWWATLRPGVPGIEFTMRPEDSVEPWDPERPLAKELADARSMIERVQDVFAREIAIGGAEDPDSLLDGNNALYDAWLKINSAIRNEGAIRTSFAEAYSRHRKAPWTS